MQNQIWGLPAAAEKGRWTALIEPILSRHMRFHLFRKSHAADAKFVVRENDDGSQRSEEVKQYAVSFNLTEIADDGMFPAEPTIRSSEQFEGHEDLRDFMQAIVDCAAQMGIVPSQETGLAGELNRTRDHLEDMRKLVFKSNFAPLKIEPARRRH